METLPKEFYFVAGITVFSILIASFILLIINTHQKKQRLNRLQKKELERQFQDTLLHSQLEIQEQTLKNISQEIHDNIGQTLSLAKLNLNTFDIEKKPTAIEKVNTSKALVGKAIADLRLLSKSLNSDTLLYTGLENAIEVELKMIERVSAITTQLEVNGNAGKTDRQKELILFRVVQEALNNAIKHAQASKISVNLHYLSPGLLLTVQDNGKGIKESSSPDDPTGGSGLRNMENRVKLIGGTFQINSEKEKGTAIIINISTNAE